jgi:hypothetical protein
VAVAVAVALVLALVLAVRVVLAVAWGSLAPTAEEGYDDMTISQERERDRERGG